jgi:hypothetical protein
MRKTYALIIAVLLSSFASAAQQDVFVLNLKYDKGAISSEQLLVIKGFFNKPVNQPQDGYKLKIFSLDDEILHSQQFNFPLETFYGTRPEWFDQEGNQIYLPTEKETFVIKDEANIELLTPYFEQAKSINIYDNNNNLALEIIVNEGRAEQEKRKEPNLRTAIIIAIIAFLIVIFTSYIVWTKKRNRLI